MNIKKFLNFLGFFVYKEPENDKCISLAIAAQNGDLSLVKSLMYVTGYDIHCENGHPFQMACESGQLEIVNFLLRHNVDPTVGNNSPLYYAAGNGHANIVSRLLQEEKVKQTPIFAHPAIWAREKGYNELSVALWGIDFKIKNEN